MIPSRIMPTYLLLFFEMMILRISIRNGMEFCYLWLKPHPMTSWKACTNQEHENLRNSRPCCTWTTCGNNTPYMSHFLMFAHWRIPSLDNKNTRFRNFNLTNSILHHLFYVGRPDSETKRLLVLNFHRKQFNGSKRQRRSIHWMTPHDQLFKKKSTIWDARCENCFCFWTKSSKIPTSKRRSASRSRKPRKRFLRGKQIAFMICDDFRVTGAHDTTSDYADLLSVALRDDNVQEFDTRWDEVFFIFEEDPTWWRPGKFVYMKNTWICSKP